MSIVAGCSGINELKVFDSEKGEKYKPVASIIENHSGIYSVDFANKTSNFAYGGGEGISYVINNGYSYE